MVYGLSCPMSFGISFPSQGSNLHPLHQRMDSQPLDNQGRPVNGGFVSSIRASTPCTLPGCILSAGPGVDFSIDTVFNEQAPGWTGRPGVLRSTGSQRVGHD